MKTLRFQKISVCPRQVADPGLEVWLKCSSICFQAPELTPQYHQREQSNSLLNFEVDRIWPLALSL
jgi:hypothetical protein